MIAKSPSAVAQASVLYEQSNNDVATASLIET
jgi:hypothetical protein